MSYDGSRLAASPLTADRLSRTLFSHGAARSDINDDGCVNGTDYTILDNAYYSGNEPPESRCDLSGDGVVNGTDYTSIDNDYNQQWAAYRSADPLVSYPLSGTFAGVWSASDRLPAGLCDFGHQGLMHEQEIAWILARTRNVAPGLGRHDARDIAEYADGPNTTARYRLKKTGCGRR